MCINIYTSFGNVFDLGYLRKLYFLYKMRFQVLLSFDLKKAIFLMIQNFLSVHASHHGANEICSYG